MNAIIKKTFFPSAVMALTWAASPGLRAQSMDVVFDSFATPAFGYSSADLDTTYGALLTLTQTGTLGRVGFSLYNHEGSGGSIVAGSMKLSLYDASSGYSGGALNLPLLGTVAVALDLSGSPLLAGYGNTYDSGDLTSRNIPLPSKILVIQQFEMTQGSATRYGIAARSTPPIIGTSTGSYYLSNSMNSPGLYSATGGGNAFPLYQISVIPVPEPAGAAMLCGLGLLGWMVWRRCGRSAS